MNLNHFFNAISSTENSNIHNQTQKCSNLQTPPLYPTTPNFDFQEQSANSGQLFNQQKNNANSPNFASLMQLFNLFSKKQDLSSLLASPIGKSLGINENIASILNLFGNKKSKTLSIKNESSLPKIDSLERIKW